MKSRSMSAGMWGAAVVLAVGAGTAAVAAASPGSDRQVLTRNQIDHDLGGLPSTAPATTTSQAATPPAQGGPSQTLTVPGGTVVVQCDGGTATLLRWSPSSGFRADDPIAGPAAAVSIRFDSDGGGDQDVTVTATCVNGTASATTTPGGDNGRGRGPGGPAATSTPTDDDHGGDKHGGGNNSGKGGHGKDGDG